MKALTLAPDAPPPFTRAEAHAIRSVMLGEADADQQRAAMDWIIRTASGYYGNPFRFGENATLESFFMGGRAFVGGAIVTIVNMNILPEEETHAR